jgi:glycosyltransferase involved in cell wall biosynthesis
MKVLHIIASLDESTGGPARSVPQTCVELAKLGVEIEIICQPHPKSVKIPVLPNLTVRFLNLRELYRFGRKLDRSATNLIHLQHIWHPYIALMARAARKKNIPYIITPRGMLEPWIMARNTWKKKLAMTLYQHRDLRKAALLHVTCEEEKQHIRKLGFKQEIAVIPNGLDLSQVPKAKEDYGTQKVVFLSRIHPKKGIELLLRAWRQLNTACWTLEIAGYGDPAYIEQIREQITRYQLRNVKLVGPQYGEAKWDFLKSADLLVLPTWSENFGIVVAEALAVGVPVITTTGTPWQELETHHCGWWIDLTIENLVKSLTQAINTKPLQLKELGSNGIKLIENEYKIQTITKKIIELYETRV